MRTMRLLLQGLVLLLGCNSGLVDAAAAALMQGAAIAAGGSTTCTVYMDGSGRCYGNNDAGQLGMPASVLNVSAPKDAPLLPFKVYQFAAGLAHTCALSVAREVWCTGDNSLGACGVGGSVRNLYGWRQVQLPAVASIASSAASASTCAVLLEPTASGSNVVCWGFNQAGGLGINSRTNIGYAEAAYPAGLVELPAGKLVVMVATGGGHICFLLESIVGGSKSISCTGRNDRGQLGAGSTSSNNIQLSVAPTVDLGGRTPVAITAGDNHTCALLSTGVSCFGQGSQGALGLGSSANVGTSAGSISSSVALPARAVMIAAGSSHTCAILVTGVLICWGQNGATGRLGIGTAVANVGVSSAPSATVDLGLDSPAYDVAAGALHTCAVTLDRIAFCFGDNSTMALGVTSRLQPIGDNEAVAIAGPADIGPPYRTALPAWTEAALSFPLRDQMCTGYGFTCTIVMEPTFPQLWCFGRDTNGQLSIGGQTWPLDATPGSARPTATMPNGRSPLAVYCGDSHIAVLLDNRAIALAGLNDYGQLGRGNKDTNRYPTLVIAGLGSYASGWGVTAMAVALAASHSCIIRSDGRALCVGNSWSGECGTGQANVQFSAFTASSPVSLPSSSTVKGLCAAGRRTCVIRASDSALYCFGYGGDYALGYGGTADQNVPTTIANPVQVVSPAGYAVSACAAGETVTCAIRSGDDQVVCWGSSSTGALGVPGTTSTSSTTWVSSTGTLRLASTASGLSHAARRISVGKAHACAIRKDDSALVCWGTGTDGRLGTGSTSNVGTSNTPGDAGVIAYPLSSGESWTDVAAGETHTCALSSLGRTVCFGKASYNELGYASTASVLDGGRAPALNFGPAAIVGAFLPAVVDARAVVNYNRQVPAPGGALLQLTGVRLGSLDYSLNVSFNASFSVSAEARADHDTLVVPVSAQLVADWQAKAGQMINIIVQRGTLTSLQQYSVPLYSASVSSLVPATANTTCQCVVSVYGSGLGASSAAAPQLYLRGVPLTTVWTSSALVSFNLPLGTGASLSVLVTAGGALLPPVPRNFSFLPPRVLDVQPRLQIRAGTRLTIVGYNFGSDASMVNVSLGRSPCSNVTLFNDSHISCLAPAAFGRGQPVLVNVDGQSSDGSIALSSVQPAILGIQPNSSYTGPDASYRRTFFIAGFNLGESAVELQWAAIGGVRCPTTTWYNSSMVACPNMPALGWNSSEVTVCVGNGTGCIENEPAPLFRFFPRPTVQRITPASGRGGVYAFLSGSGLGRSTNDIRSISVAGTVLTLDRWFSPQVDTAVVQMPVMPPGPASVEVCIVDGPCVTDVIFTYVNDSMLYVNWATTNGTAQALPSSSTAPLLLQPLPTLRITDNVNRAALDAGAVVCYASITAAASVADPASAALAVPVGTVTTTATVADALSYRAMFAMGLRAPPDTDVLLTASCTDSTGRSYTVSNLLRVTVASMELRWMQQPARDGVLPSRSAAEAAPLAPLPSLQLYYRMLNGTWAVPQLPNGYALSCRADLEVSSDPSTRLLGSKVTVLDTAGRATFSALSVQGDLGARFSLLFSCTWMTGDVLAAPAVAARLAAVRQEWGPTSLPPSDLTWGRQSAPIVVKLVQLADDDTPAAVPLFNLSAVDVSCAVTAASSVSTADPVPLTFASELDSSAGTFTILNLQLLPVAADASSYPYRVLFRVNCFVQSQLVQGDTSSSVRVHAPAVVWQSPPPAFAVPSSMRRPLPIAASLSIALKDHTGSVIQGDNSSLCSLKPALISTGNGSSAVSTVAISDFAATASAVTMGEYSWFNVSVSAPFDSIVAISATCARPEGGPIVRTTANVVLAGLFAQWVIVPPSWTFYRQRHPVEARLMLAVWDGAATSLVPYEPAAFGSVACTLLTSDPHAQLLGGSALTSAAVESAGRAGYSRVTMDLAADAGLTAQVRVQCEIGDNTVSTDFVAVNMESFVVSFLVRPPNAWLPASPGARMYLRPSPVVQIVTRAGHWLDTSLISCTVLVNTSASPSAAVLEQPQDGYAFSAADNGFTLSALQVGGNWGDDVFLYVRCVRVAGDVLPLLPFTVKLPRAEVRWVQRPPSSAASREAVSFALQLFDVDTNSLMTADNFTRCTVSVLEDPQLLMQGFESIASAGTVVFSSYALSGTPGLTYTLRITCALGTQQLDPQLESSIFLTGCAPGYAPVGADRSTCVLCPDNSYSDGGFAQTCIKCGKGMTCVAGRVTLQPAHFAADALAAIEANPFQLVPVNVSDKLQLYTCLNAEACIVNSSTRSYGCAAERGYAGARCAVCRPGFSRQGDRCVQCLDAGANGFFLFLAACFLAALLVYTALFMKFDSAQATGHKVGGSRIIWRLMVNFITGLGALGIYAAKGTETFRAIVNGLQTIAVPGSGAVDIAPITCLLQPSFYGKYYAMIALPVVAAILCVLINGVDILRRAMLLGYASLRDSSFAEAARVAGTASKEYTRVFLHTRKWLSVMMLVLFLAYPTLCSVAFTVFDCDPEHIAGRVYLRRDYSARCDDAAHAAGVAVASLVILLCCIGFPVGFAYFLRRHEHLVKGKSAGDDEWFQTSFSFLFEGYRTNSWVCYCWESVIMLRKAFIVLLGSTLADPYFSVMASQLLLFSSLTAHLLVQPFELSVHNHLETASLFCLAGTQAISLLYLRSEHVSGGGASAQDPYLTADTSNSKPLPDNLISDGATTALLVLLNGALLVAMCVQYVKAVQAESATGKRVLGGVLGGAAKMLRKSLRSPLTSKPHNSEDMSGIFVTKPKDGGVITNPLRPGAPVARHGTSTSNFLRSLPAAAPLTVQCSDLDADDQSPDVVVTNNPLVAAVAASAADLACDTHDAGRAVAVRRAYVPAAVRSSRFLFDAGAADDPPRILTEPVLSRNLQSSRPLPPPPPPE